MPTLRWLYDFMKEQYNLLDIQGMHVLFGPLSRVSESDVENAGSTMVWPFAATGFVPVLLFVLQHKSTSLGICVADQLVVKGHCYRLDTQQMLSAMSEVVDLLSRLRGTRILQSLCTLELNVSCWPIETATMELAQAQVKKMAGLLTTLHVFFASTERMVLHCVAQSIPDDGNEVDYDALVNDVITHLEEPEYREHASQYMINTVAALVDSMSAIVNAGSFRHIIVDELETNQDYVDEESASFEARVAARRRTLADEEEAMVSDLPISINAAHLFKFAQFHRATHVNFTACVESPLETMILHEPTICTFDGVLQHVTFLDTTFVSPAMVEMMPNVAHLRVTRNALSSVLDWKHVTTCDVYATISEDTSDRPTCAHLPESIRTLRLERSVKLPETGDTKTLKNVTSFFASLSFAKDSVFEDSQTEFRWIEHMESYRLDVHMPNVQCMIIVAPDDTFRKKFSTVYKTSGCVFRRRVDKLHVLLWLRSKTDENSRAMCTERAMRYALPDVEWSA